MKKGLILYYEYAEHFGLLSDEELGRLIRAVLDYEKNGLVPEFTGALQMAFSFIKINLDIDRAKYEERCEKNRRNGKLGAMKKAEQKQANANSGIQMQANGSYTDTDTENDTDTVTETVTVTETKEDRGDHRLKKLAKLYEENVGEVSGVILREMEERLSLVEESLLEYAIEQAAFYGKKNWAYVGGIVDCHQKAGRRTRQAAEKASRGRKVTGESPPRYDFSAFERQARGG